LKDWARDVARAGDMRVEVRGRSVVLGCRVFAAVAAAVAVAGCSSQHTGDTAEAYCSTANMDPAVPIDTAQDWVTYADHLVEVRVVSEADAQKDADDGEPDTGYEARTVDVQLDQVLWSRPDAPQVPANMTWEAAGWTYDGDDREKSYWWGFPRIEVGHTYVVPIAYWRTGQLSADSHWGPFTESGILPYDDGVLGDGEQTPCAEPDWAPVAKRVIGETSDALAAILNDARPDPRAVPYMGLGQRQRYLKAVR
jgi:hypothetical protein